MSSSWVQILITLGRAIIQALNSILNPAAKYAALAASKLEQKDFELKQKAFEQAQFARGEKEEVKRLASPEKEEL